MNEVYRFDSALYGISERVKKILENISPNVKNRTEEIRLRAEQPVALTVRGKPMFVREDCEVCEYIASGLLRASSEEIKDSFRLLCRNSVYAHTAEIKNGFIIMHEGHRAGICGTVTGEGNIRDISSINIRIARQIKGCATPLAEAFNGGMLIAGPPGSGKTTVLRDLIRQLSDGIYGDYRRITVIDSRGELSASADGMCGTDLGRNTDILITQNRAAGIEMAVRTLFPDIVAFDELGTVAELKSISDGFNAGVDIITTAHIGSRGDIMKRSVTRELLETGAVSKIVILTSHTASLPTIHTLREFLYEYSN